MFLKLLGSSVLFCVVILMTSFSTRELIYADPCSRINATVKISKDQNEVTNVRAEISGAKTPIRYFFSNSKGDLVTSDFNSAEAKNLKPGKYTCLIREAGGCRKLIEFEVK
jgi:hypothetical protein